MSAAKHILLALAAAYTAAAESLTQQADALEGEAAAPAAAPAKGNKAKGADAPAPAPRAAVGGAKAKKNKAPAIDFDTLKSKLLDNIVKEKGKEVAVACLDRFGAQKLGDLSEEQYVEFNEYLDSVISGEVDPLASGDTGGEDDDLL